MCMSSLTHRHCMCVIETVIHDVFMCCSVLQCVAVACVL